VDGSGSITTSEKTGELNAGQTAVLNGSETTTVRNTLGRITSTTTRVIAGGGNPSTVLAQETYTYSGGSLLEDYSVTDLAGRIRQYFYGGCCGLLESEVDADGRTIAYQYDTLKRKISTTTLFGAAGVKVTNTLDAVGRVLVEQRLPSAGGTVHNLNQYQYDILGRVTRHTNAWNGVTTYSYDPPNRRTTTTSPDTGTRIEDLYRDGRLKKLSGTAVAGGVRYDYAVQPEGTESIQRETAKEFRLDANGNDTSEWTMSVADDQGRNLKTYFAKVSSPYPFSENVYNLKGQLVKESDPDGVTQLFAYDSQGRRTRTATDLNGNGVINLTDGNTGAPDDRITDVVMEVVAAAASGKSPPVDLVRTRTYVFGTNDSATTSLVSTVEVSSDGRKSWQTVYRDTGGGTPVTTYLLTGLPASGSRTDTVTRPDGSYTERVYSYGRLVTVREKNSGGTVVTQKTMAYDSYGRVSSETDLRNGAASYTYNDADQVKTVTAPALGTGEPAQVTDNTYDAQGRLTGQVLPDGTTVTRTYKKTGLLEKMSGSRTYPVEYDYDGQGRMTKMKTWQTYAGGAGTAAVTTWVYNAYRGWLASKDYPDATTGAAGTLGPTYTYTDAGRLATRTWQRGVVATYEYKVAQSSPYTAGDLRLVTYSSDPTSTPSSTYTYDRRGRWLTSVRNGITTTGAYNEANLPLSELNSGGTLHNLSVVRSYSSQLRLDTLDAKNGTSFLQRAIHTYDTAGRLDQVKDNAAPSYYAKYAYEPNSRLVKSLQFTNNTAGEGLLTTRTWDKLNRLTTIGSQAYLNQAATGNQIGFTYQYNRANQRTRADLADGTFWVYQYDSLGQVISGRRYWGDGALMDGQNFEYGFDEIGNRTATGGRASSVSDYRPSGYPVNQINQYQRRTVADKVDVFGLANPTAGVTVQKDLETPLTATRRGEYFHLALTVPNSAAQYPALEVKSLYGATQTIAAGKAFVPPATEIFGYDSDGNLTSDGRWTTYVWDGENRLIEMRRDTATPAAARQRLTFEYDALGRRIRKIFFTHNGSAWVEARDTIYHYDGWNLVAELDGNASNAILRTYVWGTDLSGSGSGAGGVGGLLWVNNAQAAGGLPTGIQFAAYDGNGNVVGLFAAADGATTARYEYGPFGEPLRGTGSLAKANPIRWSTKVTDDEGGSVYYGLRYVSAATGRWLSRDPIEERGGVNLNGFVGNDSVNAIDSLGEDFIAVGGWPVLGVGVHMSLAYYKTECNDPNEGFRFRPALPPPGFRYKTGVQLWTAWFTYKHTFPWRPKPTLPPENRSVYIPISYIQRIVSATRMLVLFSDAENGKGASAAGWSKIISEARGYQYAEQADENEEPPTVLSNWPNSWYQLLGNNSNTFIRQMSKQINRDPDLIGGGWIAGNIDPEPIEYPGWTPVYSPRP
jgi:RHS repeat-associated protein